jgi:hypothetical protein
MDILTLIQTSAQQKILFSPHAVRQMSRTDRMISPEEVKSITEKGLMIEDYPDDERGHSCLFSGKGTAGRVIHVVCSPRKEYLCIITAYLPDKENWEDGFKRRR